MAKVTCGKCGHKNLSTRENCLYCGSPFGAINLGLTADSAIETPPEPNAQKRWNEPRRLARFVFLPALLALVAGGGYFVFRDGVHSPGGTAKDVRTKGGRKAAKDASTDEKVSEHKAAQDALIRAFRENVERAREETRKRKKEQAWCRKCSGTGLLPCNHCNGAGTVSAQFGEIVTCWQCDGSGQTRCRICHGRGTRG